MTPRQSDISVVKKWADKAKAKAKGIGDFKGCAWCNLYYVDGRCSANCLLVQINECCNNDNSTWMKWYKDKTPKNAKAMLLKCIEAIRTARKYKDKKFCNEALRRVK